MEAFDETLDRRIWSLADNRIKWHTLIAERRRKVPTETEKTVTALLGHHHKLDDEALPDLLNADEETANEQDGKFFLSSVSSPVYLSENSDVQTKRIEQTLLEASAAATELDQVSDKVSRFSGTGLTG
jgi:hypothetical protein